MDTCGRWWRWTPHCIDDSVSLERDVKERIVYAWEYKGKEIVKSGNKRLPPELWRKSEQVSKLEVLVVCGPSAVRE